MARVCGTGDATLCSHRPSLRSPQVPPHKPPPCTSCRWAELPVASLSLAHWGCTGRTGANGAAQHGRGWGCKVGGTCALQWAGPGG